MTQQLACTYAALILSDSGKLDADSLLAVTKAAGVEVSVGMAHAFATALSTVNVADTLASISFAGGAAHATDAAPAAGGAAAGGAAAPAAEAKKDEPAEEEDDDMGFGLFD